MPKLHQTVIYTWGNNCCGQLGQDKKTNVDKPTPVNNFLGKYAYVRAKSACNVQYAPGVFFVFLFGALLFSLVMYTVVDAGVDVLEVSCGDNHTCLRTGARAVVCDCFVFGLLF